MEIDNYDANYYQLNGKYCHYCIERINLVVSKKISKEKAEDMLNERIKFLN